MVVADGLDDDGHGAWLAESLDQQAAGDDTGTARELGLPLESLADLPVVAKRVRNPTDPPSVPDVSWPHHFRSGSYRFCKRCVRIFDDHNQASRATRNRLWTEIPMLRRLIGDAKLSPCNAQLCND
jgi:hypothetical protein